MVKRLTVGKYKSFYFIIKLELIDGIYKCGEKMFVFPLQESYSIYFLIILRLKIPYRIVLSLDVVFKKYINITETHALY